MFPGSACVLEEKPVDGCRGKSGLRHEPADGGVGGVADGGFVGGIEQLAVFEPLPQGRIVHADEPGAQALRWRW